MNWSPPKKVIIQGITEFPATSYAVQMQAYGTEIVAGVSPGEGGIEIGNIPVFDLVEQVITQDKTIDTSLIFVRPYQVLDAAKEAITAGIRFLIIFTPRVPPLDTIELIKYAETNQTLLLGPSSHGLVIPQKIWLGKLEPQYYQPGSVGLITSSQHLCYEVAAELNQANMGQSLVVSLGEERILGSNLSQWLSILNQDSHTEAIVLIGQSINETNEIAAYCQTHGIDKPVVVYIAGLNTPQDKVFRDAVTIISNHLSASIPAFNCDWASPTAKGNRQTINKLKKAGITIAKRPSEIPTIIQESLSLR
ncbi:hypothetical protein [Pleurocapsa sp. PCC 7319]|uniref:succinate--CoA ligase subunit alpha n=1 Tax=Pleurocapsa sp. PCC 7319 TaxID=118161 RepID=UPI0003752327|nr:hypothetical protein [Pleurocapsa sp. PCC 7319]